MVFDKIFNLDQIGSGQAIGEPLYPTMFKILYFKCRHPVLHEQYWPMLFYCYANVAQVLSRNGPKNTSWCAIGPYQKPSRTDKFLLLLYKLVIEFWTIYV